MNVAVLSMFRDSTGYLSQYFAQVKCLSELLHGEGSRLRIVACENDSEDETYRWLDRNLQSWPGSRLIEAKDDCPYYPSLELPERWRHIAWVCNQLLDQVDEADDVVLYVESDLRWQPDEMLRLVHLAKDHGAVTCPSYLKVRGGRYYDTWGSRRGGARFSSRYPYTPEWTTDRMLAMDSCASVLAVKAKWARDCRFTEEDGFVGWSRAVRSKNGYLWMATDLAVVHP
jgi:glycosyltransferase involved in cell wall biosynthesis